MSILENDFKRPPVKARSCMRLATFVSVAFMLLIMGVARLILFLKDVPLPLLVDVALLAWAVLWLAYTLVAPALRYRRYRYLIDHEKIVVKEGLLFISQDFAPIERVHQISVQSGPIDRIYGLAKVTATTAGGIVTVRFLPIAEAEEIAQALQAKVRHILKQQGISLDPLSEETGAIPQADSWEADQTGDQATDRADSREADHE